MVTVESGLGNHILSECENLKTYPVTDYMKQKQ
jgi:hypothetical protein